MTGYADIDAALGKAKTPEDLIEDARWWLRELGDALPEASPIFKALVQVVRERDEARDLLVEVRDLLGRGPEVFGQRAYTRLAGVVGESRPSKCGLPGSAGTERAQPSSNPEGSS